MEDQAFAGPGREGFAGRDGRSGQDTAAAPETPGDFCEALPGHIHGLFGEVQEDHHDGPVIIAEIGVGVVLGQEMEGLAMDPATVRSILAVVKRTIGDLAKIPQKPVVIVSVDIRRYFRKMIEKDYYELPVLSFQELSSEINIQPLGRLKL